MLVTSSTYTQDILRMKPEWPYSHSPTAHNIRPIPADTSRIAFYSPTSEQIQEGILVPDEDTVSLYDTPYNEFFVYLPTPNQVALDEPHESLGEVHVTPITLN